jgi:hypothetical protein
MIERYRKARLGVVSMIEFCEPTEIQQQFGLEQIDLILL